MTLHRLILRPSSPWRTPWQADTLTGMLLTTCARTHGSDILRDRLMDPMLAGEPPFVLSDAFPGDLLPFPLALRLADWPPDTDFKALKRARWLTPEHFLLARAGKLPPFDALIPDSNVFLEHIHHHNTLSRHTDTTGDAEQGLAPFTRAETMLLNVSTDGDYLSVYFRILQPAAADLFINLFHELSLTGFGADASIGRGQFDIQGDPEPMPALNLPPSSGSNAVVCLSTFQPGPTDPTDGYWETFPKFGKLGPDLGLAHVRKNTLILFRPGACFRTDTHRPYLGRAVPMNELLPPATAEILVRRGFHIIHPAFALTTPAVLPNTLPSE